VSTTAPSAAQPGSAAPAHVPYDDPATVPTLRGQIDALDAAIVRLVAERAQLSRRIQTARINAGGTRVELGRERGIVERYRSALGGSGSGLADAVLRVCRG
jgi:chorismate mutase